MDLFVSATSEELQPFIESLPENSSFLSLICGVGCVETTLNLTRFLQSEDLSEISKVINVGIAGAFLDTGLQILDVCIAERETLADFGICIDNRIEPFTFSACPKTSISLDRDISAEVKCKLESKGLKVNSGNFITVNSVSGTATRGNYLRDQHQAVCENMEGFAVAKVCHSFNLPFVEIRCVSNFVEDRNNDKWKFKEACNKLAEIACFI